MGMEQDQAVNLRSQGQLTKFAIRAKQIAHGTDPPTIVEWDAGFGALTGDACRCMKEERGIAMRGARTTAKYVATDRQSGPWIEPRVRTR
jgi:hypothetical protein